MSNLTVAQRVSNGIDLLNQKGPKDWVDRIELKRLDIKDTCNCILGFSYGDVRVRTDDNRAERGFHIGAENLGLNLTSAVACGFEASRFNEHSDEFVITSEYDLLQAEWTRRLTELKAERAAKENIIETHDAPLATMPADLAHMEP